MRRCFVTIICLLGLSEINFQVPMINNLYGSAYLSKGYRQIYQSPNLAGHNVFAECNPGGTTSCPCDATDAAIISYQEYGVIIANPNKRGTFVNAIGFKKFTDNLLPDLPIDTGVYKYSGEIKLPSLPKPDDTQQSNPQAVHIMIQLYDGNNQIWNEGKVSVEAAIYWDLNPWSADYGKIKVYTEGLILVSTGILLPPDTDWHYFELVADFHTMKYTSITVGDQSKDLSTIKLAKVARPDWGNDLSFSITTESENASNNCDKVFYWETYFRNLNLGKSILPVGINDDSKYKTAPDDIFKVYPNPTTGMIEITILEPIENDYKIELFNNLGKLLKIKSLYKSENPIQIDLSIYPIGLYTVKLKTNEGVFQYKIIKK